MTKRRFGQPLQEKSSPSSNLTSSDSAPEKAEVCKQTAKKSRTDPFNVLAGSGSWRDCPVCGEAVVVSFLDRHVNAHLDSEDLARDRALAESIQNGPKQMADKWSLRQLESAEPDWRFQRPGDGKSQDTHLWVKCRYGCENFIPLDEMESHRLQHQLETGDETLEDPMKVNEFHANVQKSPGQESRVGATGRKLPVPSRDELLALVHRQGREARSPSDEGIMALLHRCLLLETNGSSHSAISGYVEHYASERKVDLGWGCGWRNIQMMASHLLKRDEEARKVLFGGVGFVPDILALQQWLEFSWRLGFDEVGAEQLGWHIANSEKWIGTTECAALLRSFGFRANIVDFKSSTGKRSGVGNKAGSKHGGGGPGLGGTGKGSGRRLSEPERITKHYKRIIHDRKAVHAKSKLKSTASGDGSVSPGGSRDSDEEDQRCSECNVFAPGGFRAQSSAPDRNSCPFCVENASKEVEDGKDAEDDVTKPEDLGKTLGREKGSSGSSSDVVEAGSDIRHHLRLVEWVWDYFTGDSRSQGDLMQQPVCVSNKPPLYFQHQGHSRTIVGIERRKARAGQPEEVFLLVLDPSQKSQEIMNCLRNCKGWQRMIKRGVHTLRKAEYQLCYVQPGLAEGQELQNLKVLQSVLYSY